MILRGNGAVPLAHGNGRFKCRVYLHVMELKWPCHSCRIRDGSVLTQFNRG